MIRKFKPSDYSTLSVWYSGHDLKCPPFVLLSTTGFISKNAAGFLYLTNSSLAIIDGYITDINCSAESRWASLNLITEALIKLAKELGCTVIKADSKFESIIALGESFGFRETGSYISIKKDL